MNAQTIRDRVRAGVPPEEAITAPRHGVIRGKRSKPRRYIRIDWKRAHTLHVRQGLLAAEVARELGASPQGVREGLQRRGWLQKSTPAGQLEHGRALYRVWGNLRERRGLRALVPAWRDFARFHAWALRAGYEPGLVLTRVDRRAQYGSRNCRWLRRQESLAYGRPTRVSRKPHWTIRAFGESKGPAAWARDPRCVVTFAGLLARLERGLDPEAAITRKKRREGVEPDGKAVEAWGVTKSLKAWARDRRARVGAGAIGKRLDRGMAPEAAITTPPFRQAPQAARRMRS